MVQYLKWRGILKTKKNQIDRRSQVVKYQNNVKRWDLFLKNLNHLWCPPGKQFMDFNANQIDIQRKCYLNIMRFWKKIYGSKMEVCSQKLHVFFGIIKEFTDYWDTHIFLKRKSATIFGKVVCQVKTKSACMFHHRDDSLDTLYFSYLGNESDPNKIPSFGHMSKPSLPYLPSDLVWTKKSFNK